MAKFNVQIPTEIVRNPDIKATEFILIAKLIQSYYLVGKKEEFEINHRVIMNHLNIKDNETFKEAFNGLFEKKYIYTNIKSLPKKVGVKVKINPDIIPELNKDKKGSFTQLTKNVLNKSVVTAIGHVGVRLLYFFKSYINAKDGKPYCYASEEVIADQLGISKNTVISYNKKLSKNSMIKIESHALENNNEYIRRGDKEIIYFTKYNNHYFVFENEVDDFVVKNLEKMAY